MNKKEEGTVVDKKGYWIDDDGCLCYGTGTADRQVVGEVNHTHAQSLGKIINNTNAINADNVNLREEINNMKQERTDILTQSMAMREKLKSNGL